MPYVSGVLTGIVLTILVVLLIDHKEVHEATEPDDKGNKDATAPPKTDTR